jgi:hypothetical protein
MSTPRRVRRVPARSVLRAATIVAVGEIAATAIADAAAVDATDDSPILHGHELRGLR